uniref:Uncharacterized protein n=1 Tax=Peronospora matthiolae TaxID=2874970 RepID=A0AAV1TWK5_9STRA
MNRLREQAMEATGLHGRLQSLLGVHVFRNSSAGTVPVGSVAACLRIRSNSSVYTGTCVRTGACSGCRSGRYTSSTITDVGTSTGSRTAVSR